MAPRAGPPDGGWGWMIVAGCFLVTICTRAVTRCISIFFVEFQAYFGQDYARTAWIHSIVDCATMLCAPLGSLISNHVSCQVGIMLGGLLASTGLILSSFATSLEHLYLSLGVLTGWLVDTTGSYTASFLLCGFSMIFSSVLLCFARLAKKMKRTRLKSLSNDTHSKQHIWTNGAIAYSVTGELDQKDAEFLPVDTNSYSNR